MLTTAQAWDILARVPDPEIPAISVTELGIVRDVQAAEDGVDVVVTPTYSGCPATEVIERSIREALSAAGARDVRVRQQLSPAWSTDWIAEDARERLRALRHRAAGRAAGGRRAALVLRAARGLPALRQRRHRAPVAVRLDGVQGAVPLPRLPRALRILQADLDGPRRLLR